MRRVRRRAWILLVVLASIVALFSLGATFVGIDENEFETSTGVAWSELRESSPSIATYIVRLERLIGVGYFVVGLTWVALTLRMLRHGHREAWFFLWGMPLVFGGASVVFIAHEALGLGIYYGVLTLVAVAGLVLSYSSPDPGSPGNL